MLNAMEVGNELSQVRIAREFADVFEPVTGLPLKRVVEFRIGLVPGAEPVSRPPNRMTLIEMKELK